MKRDNKKALYESIMIAVAREVKKALNEISDSTILGAKQKAEQQLIDLEHELLYHKGEEDYNQKAAKYNKLLKQYRKFAVENQSRVRIRKYENPDAFDEDDDKAIYREYYTKIDGGGYYMIKCPMDCIYHDGIKPKRGWAWGFYTITLYPTSYTREGRTLLVRGEIEVEMISNGQSRPEKFTEQGGLFKITYNPNTYKYTITPYRKGGDIHFMHFDLTTSKGAFNQNDNESSSFWISKSANYEQLSKLVNILSNPNIIETSFEKKKSYRGEEL